MIDPVDEAYERGNDAFHAGRLDEAVVAYDQALRALAPSDDGRAADVYENLGLTLWKLGRWRPATRALLRALDGVLTAREQALRALVSCLFLEGRSLDGERCLSIYERAFGPHPEKWTRGR